MVEAGEGAAVAVGGLRVDGVIALPLAPFDLGLLPSCLCTTAAEVLRRFGLMLGPESGANFLLVLALERRGSRGIVRSVAVADETAETGCRSAGKSTGGLGIGPRASRSGESSREGVTALCGVDG